MREPVSDGVKVTVNWADPLVPPWAAATVVGVGSLMVKSLPGLTVIPVMVRGWVPAFSMVKAPDEELPTIADGRTTV